MTAYAALQVAFGLPALLLLALNVLGGVLAMAVVGIGLLLVTLPASRWLADLHRQMAADVLGVPVEAAYRPTAGLGVVDRLRVWAADPMTWRDQVWLLATCSLGLALSLLTVLLFVFVVTGLIWYFGVAQIMTWRSRLDRALLTVGHTEVLEDRVHTLTEDRAHTLDENAAELRRIERDLHDGAQARLVAVSMTLGLAGEMLPGDPDGVATLLAEARTTTAAALSDLRSVVRQIYPAVLADRGLLGAVQALALDLPMEVEVSSLMSGRLAAPVESAVYFGIAECLTNVVKHAAADSAWVVLDHAGGVLRVVVGDDGRGGADPAEGTGIRGVMRRLAAFDGTMGVSSPRRGPTLVTLEVPCDLSSPRILPSSGTG